METSSLDAKLIHSNQPVKQACAKYSLKPVARIGRHKKGHPKEAVFRNAGLHHGLDKGLALSGNPIEFA